MNSPLELYSQDFDLEIFGNRLHFRKLFNKDINKDKPILVFLHEGLGCIDLWRDFPHELASAVQCNAIIYDRLGHGKSDSIKGQSSEYFMHDEARETLPEIFRKLEIKNSILIGHSDGGSIALMFASKYPDLVSGIITEAAHVFVEELTLHSITEAVGKFSSTNFHKKLETYHGSNTKKLFKNWSETWLSSKFRDWNIEEFLPGINCPAFIIQGEDDEYGTAKQVEKITEGIGDNSIPLILPDCGHTPHQQASERVMNEMKNFIVKL